MELNIELNTYAESNFLFRIHPLAKPNACKLFLLPTNLCVTFSDFLESFMYLRLTKG